MFVTSDTHFGHANIIKYCNRPFKTVSQMNRELVDRWNAKVPRRANVYHLGDFAFRIDPDELEKQVLKRLNGKIHLLLGNHDEVLTKNWSRFGRYFSSQTNYREIRCEGKRLVLFHFPIESWHKAHRGAWHLHGHCHGSLPDNGRCRMDVGTDTHPNLEPYNWDEIVAFLGSREHKPVDHHKS